MRWWALCSCQCWSQGSPISINCQAESVSLSAALTSQQSRGFFHDADQEGRRLCFDADWNVLLQMTVWGSTSCLSGQGWQIAECMVLCCSAGSAAPWQTALSFPALEWGQYRVHLAWLHVAAALALHQPFKAPYVLRLAGRAVECQEQSSQ